MEFRCSRNSSWFFILSGVLMLCLMIGAKSQAAEVKDGDGVSPSERSK